MAVRPPQAKTATWALGTVGTWAVLLLLFVQNIPSGRVM